MRRAHWAASESGEIRDGFVFRGGHAALDLTATLRSRLKGAPIELLDSPEAVFRWLDAAGLETDRNVWSDTLVLDAIRLREAIYGLALAIIEGSELPEASRQALNRFASCEAPVPELNQDATATVCGNTASRYLTFLAREAVLLFGSERAGRIRKCHGTGCAILYLDESRSGARKWCSMNACGNRRKVSKHRKMIKQSA